MSANGNRDFDFYEFVNPTAQDITITSASQVPMSISVVQVVNCPTFNTIEEDLVLPLGDCMPVTGTAVNLPPGTYLLAVTSGGLFTNQIFSCAPCVGANDYYFSINTGAAGCQFPTGLINSDCNTGELTTDLVASSCYNSIDFIVTAPDGTETTIMGTTAYATGDPIQVSLGTFVDPGVYDVEVTANCCNSDTSVGVAQEGIYVFTGQTDIIFDGGSAGCIDSARRMRSALLAEGRDVMVIDNTVTLIDGYECLDQLTPTDTVWVALGTFPNNVALLPDEASRLVGVLVTQTASVYLEGGDFWGFDAPNDWYDFDGVEGTAATGNLMLDGDDSCTSISGIGTGFITTNDLNGGMPIAYEQDNFFGDDFTDQLNPSNGITVPEDMPLFSTAEVMFANNDDGVPDPLVTEGTYGVMISYDTNDTDGFGDVVSSSIEFGGIGDATLRGELMAKMLAALKGAGGEQFIRGDCNGDTMTNIADAVRVLNVLFPQGCTPGVDCPTFDCADACDANDDGTNNIADAVATLNVLFPQGCTPGVDCPVFPSPNPGCGPDPTADALPACIYTCP